MPVQQGAVKNTWGQFDGNPMDWLGFRDRFVTAVHDNADISPAYKFGYLKKSLIGSAAKALGDWQLDEQSYVEAWQRLLQRYDKKYPICRAHLKALDELPKLSGAPTAKALQNLVDVSHVCVRQLRALGVPVDQWDMILVHIVHERLDIDTARQWELAREGDIPSFKQMLEFLEKQAASLPSTSAAMRQTEQRKQKADYEKVLYCHICDGRHPTYRCQELAVVAPNVRRQIVLDNRLCLNCLKPGHLADKCAAGPCGRCPNIKHNSVLCPERANWLGKRSHRME